jgi:flagellar biosynthesis/type III secretory pathway protein FliH
MDRNKLAEAVINKWQSEGLLGEDANTEILVSQLSILLGSEGNEEALDKAYECGYDEGYSDGHEDAFEDAEDDLMSST